MMMSQEEIERIAELVAAITPATFLTSEEVAVLSGRKSKSRQIEALRAMCVPFLINDVGHPVVARSFIEGKKTPTPAEKPKWVPAVLKNK